MAAPPHARRSHAASPQPIRPWTGLVGALVATVLIAGGLIVVSLLRQGQTPAPKPPAPTCTATLVDGRQARLDLEQAGNASLIAGVANQRGLIPRATSIALATAFQESGLRNLDYGDLDSLGLFQQRPAAGWGTPEQIMDPYYSTGKFFDALARVPDWQTADIGDVAQEIQRSAFPDSYDQHVERARILASALTGETPAAWSCHLRNPQPADPAGLAAGLSRTFGDLVTITLVPAVAGDPTTPDTPATPARLTVQAASTPLAWSAAAFAQSWAPTYGVRQVQVGDYVWTGQSDVQAGWVGQPGSADPATAEATVEIVFGAA